MCEPAATNLLQINLFLKSAWIVKIIQGACLNQAVPQNSDSIGLERIQKIVFFTSTSDDFYNQASFINTKIRNPQFQKEN